ncbi:YihY/virulence factor BrkB family protein [Persephonella sp.]
MRFIHRLNPYRFLKPRKGKSYIRNFLGSFYRAFLDYFIIGFGYHSASISYFTLMSFFPLLVVLTVVLSFLADINVQVIIEVIQRFFPSVTQGFLDLLVTLSSKRAVFGIIGLIIAFYFASKIFTAIHNAVVYVFDGREVSLKKTAFVYIFAVPVFTVALIIIYVAGLIVSSILQTIKNFALWKYLEKIFGLVHLNFLLEVATNITNVVHFLTFFIIIFLIYRYLTPLEKIKLKDVFWSTILISFLLFLLKTGFNYYIVLASKTNPIYGSLSGIFVFLAWLYMSFGAILIGARMLYYLEKLENSS